MTLTMTTSPYNGNKTDNNSTTRSIGEIVTSTIPLVDACLHLADGSIIKYGMYSTFVEYMSEQFLKNPYLFCTEEEYQQSLTDYGVCGKYVYDSEANTVRLPTITGFIEGANETAELGNVIEAGLPNITGKFQASCLTDGGEIGEGALYVAGDSPYPNAQHNGGFKAKILGLDLSKDNTIYKDNYNKIQPQSIKILYYVVIANSTKTDIQVNIDNVITDLNSKADVTLANSIPEQSFIDMAMNWALPDYSKAILKPYNTENTAECAGMIFVTDYYYIVYKPIIITINNFCFTYDFGGGNGVTSNPGMMYVSKGDVYKASGGVNVNLGATLSGLVFVPLKGVSNA